MNNDQIREAFLTLTTPAIADACRHLNLAVRAAPLGIAPVAPEMRLAGRAFPAQFYGSFDIVLEAIDLMENGEVLVLTMVGAQMPLASAIRLFWKHASSVYRALSSGAVIAKHRKSAKLVFQCSVMDAALMVRWKCSHARMML